MQHKAVYLLFCKFAPHVSGVSHTLAWPRWREVAAQNMWPVTEAVVTVSCTPDDGCGWHPKHLEWTCRIMNRLLCVASRWTTINIKAIFAIHVKTNELWVDFNFRLMQETSTLVWEREWRSLFRTDVADGNKQMWKWSLEIWKEMVIFLVSLKIATLLQYPEDTEKSDEYLEQNMT